MFPFTGSLWKGPVQSPTRLNVKIVVVKVSSYLVTHEHLDNVLIRRICFEFVQPVLNFHECVPVCHVVDEDDALASAIVTRGQGPESFLSGCVPDCQFHL